MIAYCGIDCSKCIGYIATQSGSKEKIAEAARTWSAEFKADIKPEHVICDGCKANARMSFHCSTLCAIRKCAVKKNLSTCAECGEFPCKDISALLEAAPDAKKTMEKLRKYIQ